MTVAEIFEELHAVVCFAYRFFLHEIKICSGNIEILREAPVQFILASNTFILQGTLQLLLVSHFTNCLHKIFLDYIVPLGPNCKHPLSNFSNKEI